MALFFVGGRAWGLTSFEDGIVIARHEVDYLRPVDYARRATAAAPWSGSSCGSRRSGRAGSPSRYELFDGEVLASRARSVLRAVRPRTRAARAGSPTTSGRSCSRTWLP